MKPIFYDRLKEHFCLAVHRYLYYSSYSDDSGDSGDNTNSYTRTSYNIAPFNHSRVATINVVATTKMAEVIMVVSII
jgi:hypothetical protein